MTGRTFLAHWAGLFVVCGSAAYSGGACAQDAAADTGKLEEIIVTAERRESDVQKTAATVEVRSGNDLTKEGKYTLSQILEDVPGVTIVNGAGVAGPPGAGDAPGTSIVIRGAIPNSAATGNSVVPTTAVYTDGIYSGLGGDYDIDRVEVLLGPQGTLYGRSSTAGVVATHTHDPVLGKFSVDGTVEAGDYSLNHDTGVINLPLGDQLAVRAAGNYYSRDGYVSAQGGYTKTEEGKVKVLYKPSDDVSLLVGAALQENYPNAGGILLYTTVPGVPFNLAATPRPSDTFYQVPAPLVGNNVTRFHQYWAELNWNLGFGKLTYLPAYRDYFENVTAVGNFGAFPIAQSDKTPSEKFITHELRLASEPGSKLIWQVGALYYDNDDVHSSITVINNATQALVRLAQISKDTTDFGVFGEATMPFADTWRLTAGLRYDKTKIDSTETFTSASNPFGLAPGPNVITSLGLTPGQGSDTFNNLTFKARLEKDLTASNLLYTSISTGFLPGDVQLTLVVSGLASVPGAVTYAQEKLTAYEIGSKNRFFDDRLQLNGAAFYYDYSGYQTSTRTSPLTTSLAIVTSPARMYGGELEGIFQLTANDRVGVTYAYTHAAYVDEPSCPGSTTTICFAQVIANTSIANIAPSTLTGNYDHDFHLAGNSRLNFYADARFTSAYSDANFLPAYIPYQAYVHVDGQWVGDLSASWISPSNRYSLTGYVRNVANNNYGNGVTLAGLGTTFTASSALRYDPRTWGVIVHASF